MRLSSSIKVISSPNIWDTLPRLISSIIKTTGSALLPNSLIASWYTPASNLICFSISLNTLKQKISSNLHNWKYIYELNNIKYLVVHIPHSGGTAIRRTIFNDKSEQYEHLPSENIINIYKNSLDICKKILIISNPVNRIISAMNFSLITVFVYY